MANKKKGLLPKVEVLIILVFFLSFIAWAMTKCNATQMLYEEEAVAEEQIEEPDDNSTADVSAIPNADSDSETATATPSSETASSSSSTSSASDNQDLSRLYITIDKLKLREEPNLESDVILEFPLFERVWFMNEITEFKEEINLGKELANEPWVKVKSKKGHIGWVYGAGVHYHKQKRSGVE